RLEILVVSKSGDACVCFAGTKSNESLGGTLRFIVGVGSVDPDGPAMGRQLLNVVHIETVSRKNSFDRIKREVREVLVIDLIELIPVDGPQQMGKLDCHNAVLTEQEFQTSDEVVQVGYLGEDIVGQYQVRLPAGRRELARNVSAEKS